MRVEGESCALCFLGPSSETAPRFFLRTLSCIMQSLTRHILVCRSFDVSYQANLMYSVFLASEKAMAPYSSVLAWRIPGTGEPGGLPSLGSHRVGHDWMTSLSLFTFMPWRRQWQPTPVFLPGKFHGQRRLAGCSPQGHKESDTADVT